MPQTDGGSDEKAESAGATTGVLDDADIEIEHTVDRLLAASDPGWDVDTHVLTLQQAAQTKGEATHDSETPPAPRKPSRRPPPLPRRAPGDSGAGSGPRSVSGSGSGDMAHDDNLLDLLKARVTALKDARDPVGLGRAHLELALAYDTILGDREQALTEARRSLQADPSAQGAHTFLRGALYGRAALGEMLEHLDKEIAAASTDAHRVELLALRASLAAAHGDRSQEARSAWELALASAPTHAAALKGLEVELAARARAEGTSKDWDALEGHLGRMADAYAGDARLAAWLQVERATILERRLHRVDAARRALERAVELDGGVGPVRGALVRHLATHADWSGLADQLAKEAALEANDARAARCALDAASIVAWRLGDPTRAAQLLQDAASKAPTDPVVDRLVLDELVRLSEAADRWQDANRARRSRLGYIHDPLALAYELRTLAATAEREGDLEAAVADVQRAIGLGAASADDIEWLDRLLARLERTDPRVGLWLQEAARSEDPAARAQALLRAASICEEANRPTDALRHLRSAWVANPGDDEVLEGLSRLLAPAAPIEPSQEGSRALVELYETAAERTRDPSLRVAYLEKIALLWEEVLGDPARGARAYEQVLGIDGKRRTALIGLRRTAARAGDMALLARALLEEARTAPERSAQLGLRIRAATALSVSDAPRAMNLVREVLERDPAHPGARALETKLHEQSGRWELAAKSIRARIDATPAPADKLALWLSLARHYQVHLRAPLEAIRALEQARILDPAHPVPREEMTRILEGHSDAKLLRETMDKLAASATSTEERVRRLIRTAEIDELRAGDDASATRNYLRALSEAPESELILERLDRLTARRAKQRQPGDRIELATVLTKRLERIASTDVDRSRSLAFGLAWLLMETGQEPKRIVQLLESVLEGSDTHVQALRCLESLHRQSGSGAAQVARILERQAREVTDVGAKLGALYGLAFIEEWELPDGDAAHTFEAILGLDPTDPAALEALLRRALPEARRGDPAARRRAVTFLRSLAAFASNESARLELEIRLALLLELLAVTEPDETRDSVWREALDRYRSVLDTDPLSLVAATGLARIAGRLGDSVGALAAAESLADLAPDAPSRARYLLEGADILLGSPDPAIEGTRADRRRRASRMLERALEADPDSIAVGSRLATVLIEDGHAERLVSAFRSALARATQPEPVVMLGAEIARVARDELQDLPLGIAAMRRVREVAPGHIASLLTLAELCIAQRVWPEAVDALESVVSKGQEAGPRLTALFALASVYERVLDRGGDVERVLKTALSIDPLNARALQALVKRATQEPITDEAPNARKRREELADLLERLAVAETDSDSKSAILVDLGELRLKLDDARAAEQALVEATASAPSNSRAFTRLAGLFRRGGEVDHPGYAAALAAVIETGERLGHLDARWFASLGHAEVESLGRPQEGVVHLQRAVDLDPLLYEARYALASAYAGIKATGRAAEVLLGMLSPAGRPMLSILDLPGALALLETSLAAERRMDESIVARELRAFAGELPDSERDWLRLRRLPSTDGQPGTLNRTGLVTHVLPSVGRHALLEVAAAVAGIESRLLRSDLGEVGLTPRDRVHPRSGHPTRVLLDRILRKLDVSDAELAISPRVGRVRVLIQDVPWIIVPAALADRDEPAQMVGLTRAAARIAYGVPWIDELPAENVEAFLVAAARQAVPGYGPTASKLAAQYESAMARVLGRRQKRLLDELAPHLGSPNGAAPPIVDLVEALVQAELRAAFLLTGDLLAVADNLAVTEGAVREAVASPGSSALGLLLGHPLMGDVCRFALTPEATTLRLRAGTTWSK